MAVDTQVTSFTDLYTDLQNRVRAQTAVTATQNQAKRYINIALHDMHIGSGERFPWAERTQELITQAEYTTGTLAVSKGSTSVTGTSTLWNTNNDFGVANARVGGKMVIDGGVEVYTVSAVGSDTSITLSSRFMKTTVTAAGYVYFEDEYALHADFLRPIDLTFFDKNTEITLIGRRTFRERYPRNKVTGKPLVAAIFDKEFGSNTVPVRNVKFHKPPDDFYLIPYSFVTNKLGVSSSGTEQTQLSADTDEPIVPLQYRHAITFHALYHWYRDKRDDDREASAKAEYTDLILRITGDQEIGRPRPQMRPQVSSYVRAARQPYLRRGRRHTTGSVFDEIRE